jgi:hypothetical protein
MRDVETSIFDATRVWLDDDPTNVFHLVVDELHAYRGTPGTEVAYILRVLLDRIGLHPDHPQLRILASSASLGSDEARAQDYLRQFFGRSTPFELIRGGSIPISTGARDRVRGLASAFSQLGRAIEASDQAGIHAAVDALSADAGAAPPSAELPTERRLGDALGAIDAAEAVRAACNSGTDENPVVRPLTPAAIGSALFPDSGADEAASAGLGLVASLARSRNLESRTVVGDAGLGHRKSVGVFLRQLPLSACLPGFLDVARATQRRRHAIENARSSRRPAEIGPARERGRPADRSSGQRRIDPDRDGRGKPSDATFDPRQLAAEPDWIRMQDRRSGDAPRRALGGRLAYGADADGPNSADRH